MMMMMMLLLLMMMMLLWMMMMNEVNVNQAYYKDSHTTFFIVHPMLPVWSFGLFPCEFPLY